MFNFLIFTLAQTPNCVKGTGQAATGSVTAFTNILYNCQKLANTPSCKQTHTDIAIPTQSGRLRLSAQTEASEIRAMTRNRDFSSETAQDGVLTVGGEDN